MDVTLDYKLTKINESTNHKHWRIRSFIKDIETEISELRLTWFKYRATTFGYFCNREANRLQNLLGFSLLGKYRSQN